MCFSSTFFYKSECGKGFRYKVSQRSHKCSGVLVKQPGELIQKLMQSSSILLPTTFTSTTVSNEITNTNDTINISNQIQHETHELCLDDLLKDDAYDKVMKTSNNNVTQLIPHLVDNVFNDNSSVMTFNNMTINPNNYGMASLSHNGFNMNFPPTLETINEDSIKELLGELR